MQVNIVSIGNSKGIRIPATLLKALKIKERVELVIEKDSLIIRPVQKQIREGWAQDAKKCHTNGDDQQLIDDLLDIPEDWTW